MAIKRTDPRVVRTRQLLLAALVALVTEKPFAAVTVQDIATRAGIGYATFFRHYASREALLSAIADGMIGDLVGLIAPLLHHHDTRAAARTLTDFVAERRELCRGLLVGAGDAMRRDLTDRAVVTARVVDSNVPSWLPSELGVIHGVGATVAILGWWLEHDPDRPSEDVATIIDRLVFVPLSAA